jgi:predicted ATP-grasp superfamily ATP-dependent carboligase
LRVLLVARLFGLPYRVLRCVQGAGAEVYVLGAEQARPLGLSRYCRQFHLTDRPIDGGFDAELANEINRQIARFRIDVVLAADAPTTRALISIKAYLDAPCFPMPELAQFDLLNNKWEFGDLCRSLGIDTPETRLVSNAEALAREIENAEIRLPKVVKPLSMDGGDGVIKIEPETARAQVAQITYAPIIVQEFIDGEDICASAFCEQGEIRGFLAYSFDGVDFTAFFDQAIYNNVGKIARALKVNGVINFDMLRTKDGRISYLECNPRFFHSMAMSMVAGINFISFGLPNARPGGAAQICPTRRVQFRYPNPRPLVLGLLMPWKLKLISWDALLFLVADPLPSLRKMFSRVDEPEIDLLAQLDSAPTMAGSRAV